MEETMKKLLKPLILLFLVIVLVTVTLLPVKSYAVTQIPGKAMSTELGWTCACPWILNWNCGCIYIKPPVEQNPDRI